MKKDLLIAAFIILFITIVANGTKIQSVEEYYQTHTDEITADSKTVTLSIKCDTILKNISELDDELRNERYVPSDGVILAETQYVLRPGDTVFDILDRATRQNKIQLEYQEAALGLFGSVYVQGINYLYDFSCGSLSGWMYLVNGEFPNCGCSKYELKENDVIEWIYTCDMGRDVGCFWEGGDGGE